jgi:hypothetical protein
MGMFKVGWTQELIANLSVTTCHFYFAITLIKKSLTTSDRVTIIILLLFMMLLNHIKREKTLLAKFIAKKINSYVEPRTRGPSRGNIIGLSKRKYSATLFCITNIDLMQVATELNVSYGLLRKWRTEEKFKWYIMRHSEDFVDLVTDFVRQKIEEKFDPQDKIEQSHFKVSKSIQDDISDFNLYGKYLWNEIKRKIIKSIEECIKELNKRKIQWDTIKQHIIFIKFWMNLMKEKEEKFERALGELLRVSVESTEMNDSEILNIQLKLLKSMVEISMEK